MFLGSWSGSASFRIGLLIGLVCGVPHCAASPGDLFNGIDLAGWTASGPAPWVVENGILRNASPAGDGSSLTYNVPLPATNFAMETRFRVVLGTRLRIHLALSQFYLGNEGNERQIEIYGSRVSGVNQVGGDYYDQGRWYDVRVEVDAANQIKLLKNEVLTHTGLFNPTANLTILLSPGDGFSQGMVEFSKIRFVTPPAGPPASVELLPRGATWRYFDGGTALPSTWMDAAFDDSDWNVGPAELGYGDGQSGQATVVNCGPTAPICNSNNYPTTYFRTTFRVDDRTRFDRLLAEVVRDDGIAVYLNGVQLLRDNLPDDATRITPAFTPVGGASESFVNGFTGAASLLNDGDNVLAVELHQSGSNSSDISFDMALRATLAVPEPTSATLAFLGIAALLLQMTCRRAGGQQRCQERMALPACFLVE